MNCPQCGMPTYSGAVKCARCGLAFTAETPPVSTPPVQHPVRQPGPLYGYIPANTPPASPTWRPPLDEPEWKPKPGTQDTYSAPPEDETPAETDAPPHLKTVGETIAMLIFGLMPVLGVVFCLVWAYGAGSGADSRTLAKAMLWLHGALVMLAVVALTIWVLVLLANAPANTIF